jgi:S-adenosyl-L-methionine hydrolase (adenosine-forming)
MAHSPIVLLTDFGTQDGYVGVMKGVIAGIAPEVPILDLTHAVGLGDIRRGAIELWEAAGYFPEGTVFVTVIDPGVGTRRRPVAFGWEKRWFVGPDNGVFTFLLMSHGPDMAVELKNQEFQLDFVSTTFHGRDVFSPAGAYLAAGTPLDKLGPPAPGLMQFDLPLLEVRPRSLSGEILYVDHFGNLITSVGLLRRDREKIHISPWLPGREPGEFPADGSHVELPGGESLNLNSTFGDVPEGDLVAYIGSRSMLEVGVNRGSAAARLGLSAGDPVELTFPS